MTSDIADANQHYAIRVDGNALVIPSGCTLPMKCVVTNQPVSERSMVLANLGWTKASSLIHLLLGGPFFLLAAMSDRELCLITYGLNPKLRTKLVLYTILKILALIGLLFATIWLACITKRNPVIDPLVWISFILFCGSVVLVFMGNSPLRVVDFRDGMFWVKGFSPEYLDELEF